MVQALDSLAGMQLAVLRLGLLLTATGGGQGQAVRVAGRHTQVLHILMPQLEQLLNIIPQLGLLGGGEMGQRREVLCWTWQAGKQSLYARKHLTSQLAESKFPLPTRTLVGPISLPSSVAYSLGGRESIWRNGLSEMNN